MRARERQLVAVAAAFVFLAMACTSVDRSTQVSSGGGGGDSSFGAEGAGGAGAGGGAGPTAGDGGQLDVTAPGAAGGSAGSGTGGAGGTTAGASPGAASGDGAPQSGGSQPPAQGATAEGASQACPQDRPVKLGVSYSSDLAAGLAAVGEPEAAAQAANYTEQVEGIYQLAVDDLNRRGGLAGCQVQLVFHDFSSLASDGFDGQSQRECAHFAEDERVFAAYSAALETNVLVECLAQHKVVSFFNGAEYAPMQRDFERYRGYLYQPSEINPDRWGTFIDVWAEGGFLKRGNKVGLLIADDGTGNAQRLANEVWTPKLRQLGIDVVPFEYRWIRSYATVSDASTAFSSAVLRFSSARVTHVMSTPDGNAMSFFFTPQAESQGYRPAYRTAPNAGGTPSIAPDGQRNDWVAVQSSVNEVSLNYPDDMNDGQRATNPPNEARDRCDAIYAGKIDGPNIAQEWCDTLNFLHDALAGAPAVTPEALLAGAEGLGDSLQLALGFGASRFGPGRYDGSTQVRMAKYDPGAGDYKYVSPVRDVP